MKRISILIDENFEGLQRNILLRKVRKQAKQGRLHFHYTSPIWAYNVCCAGLIVGHYDWVGWECRSDWAWWISNTKWIYERYDGRPCKLLVLAEQGLGDELIFSSCFNELLSENPDTTIEADDRLIPIFERSFPRCRFISRYHDNKTQDDSSTTTIPSTKQSKTDHDYERGAYDAFIPAGNVPKLYRAKIEDFPGTRYLQPKNNPRLRAFLSHYPKPWVGIAWKGRQGEIDPWRLLNKGSYFSLQYGDSIPKPPKGSIRGRHHLPKIHQVPIDVTDDIEGLFSLVDLLDSVVTIPQTLAHVSGSLGKETHVIRTPPIYAGQNLEDSLFHNRVQWQWAGKMPWYKSVRTYRNIEEYHAKTKR